MSDEEDECPACPAGIPAWVMTFADLMSLLMCFFVLLLSFSEMDVMKYRQLAGSMAAAFGVQKEIDVKGIPKGTSIIAQEFSPGRPQPTPLNEVRQSTVDSSKTDLDVRCPDGETEADKSEGDEGQTATEQQMQQAQEQMMSTQSDALTLAAALETEINSGQVEVETQGTRIVIRVKEHGSFASGSATLRPTFVEVMDKMREVLKTMPGLFTVEGHTDDVPISTSRFRSNWELSASRAVSVAHELFKDHAIDPRRFTIVGYADTRPLVPNTDRASRAKNRRVEIVIQQGAEPEPIPEDSVLEPEDVEDLEDDYEHPQFDYSMDEIF